MNKTSIISVIVVLVLVVGYFYFMGGSPAIDVGLLERQSDGVNVGSKELSLLNEINSLKIDSTLFTDPAYRTLRDYSVAIPPQNVGRPNPFAPLPGVPRSNAPAH